MAKTKSKQKSSASGDVGPSHECAVCHASFSSKRSLELHASASTGNCQSSVACGDSVNRKTATPRKKAVTLSDLKLAISATAGARTRNDVDFEADTLINQFAVDERRFACVFCDAKFKKCFSLSCHLRIHADEGKACLCVVCKEQLPHANALQQHLLCHIGQKPFACSSCQESFSSSTLLECHLLVHTGSKPDECDVCGKAFRGRFSQKNHSHPEMQLKCGECSDVFDDLLSYKRHVRLHTGEKPYACERCGKRFGDVMKLNNHVKLAHPDKMPQAGYCGDILKPKTRRCNAHSLQMRNM